MFVLAFALVALAWEGYKAIGPENGGKILGWKLIPRTSDRAMPHIADILDRFGRPEVRGSGTTVFDAVLAATWYSLRLSIGALVLGFAVGMLLAVVMARFDVLERALMPFLVASQTVPLIALAPVLVSWSGRLQPFGFTFDKWHTAVLLGAFLAFFPIAVGALRGVKSVAPESVELLDSYAASWTQGLFRLRLPAAVPYLVPALKLASANAVIGVLVSEISIGLRFGIGRLILSYGQEATSDPPKVFTAVFGAAVLGLAMALLVIAVEQMLMWNRPRPDHHGANA
jgi:NitT/TauT family transport system permease protein